MGGLILTRLGANSMFKDKTFQRGQFSMTYISVVTGHSPRGDNYLEITGNSFSSWKTD